MKKKNNIKLDSEKQVIPMEGEISTKNSFTQMSLAISKAAERCKIDKLNLAKK